MNISQDRFVVDNETPYGGYGGYGGYGDYGGDLLPALTLGLASNTGVINYDARLRPQQPQPSGHVGEHHAGLPFLIPPSPRDLWVDLYDA